MLNLYRMPTTEIRALTVDDIADIPADDILTALVEWSENVDRISAVLESIKTRMTRLGFADYNQREFLKDVRRVLNGFDGAEEELKNRATEFRTSRANISIHNGYAEIVLTTDYSIDYVLKCYGWEQTGKNTYQRGNEIGTETGTLTKYSAILYRFEFSGDTMVW